MSRVIIVPEQITPARLTAILRREGVLGSGQVEAIAVDGALPGMGRRPRLQQERLVVQDAVFDKRLL